MSMYAYSKMPRSSAVQSGETGLYGRRMLGITATVSSNRLRFVNVIACLRTLALSIVLAGHYSYCTFGRSQLMQNPSCCSDSGGKSQDSTSDHGSLQETTESVCQDFETLSDDSPTAGSPHRSFNKPESSASHPSSSFSTSFRSYSTRLASKTLAQITTSFSPLAPDSPPLP